jgi:hypothetical protein
MRGRSGAAGVCGSARTLTTMKVIRKLRATRCFIERNRAGEREGGDRVGKREGGREREWGGRRGGGACHRW